MSPPHLAAVGAGDEMEQVDCIVGTALVAARLGNFSLGNCTHDISSFIFKF